VRAARTSIHARGCQRLAGGLRAEAVLGCRPRFRMGLTKLGRSGPSTASRRSGMRSSERTVAPRRFGFSPVGSSAIGIRSSGPSRRKFFPSRLAKRCNAHGMDTSEHGTEAGPWISGVARTRPATGNILVTITASCPASGRASSGRPPRSLQRALTYLRIPPCTASASAFRSCSCHRGLIGKGARRQSRSAWSTREKSTWHPTRLLASCG
jgi:hypothetical protein